MVRFSMVKFNVVNLIFSASSVQKNLIVSEDAGIQVIPHWPQNLVNRLNPAWYAFLDYGAIECHV